eukprot:13592900-Heterocapsa_arctica.AAC.1
MPLIPPAFAECALSVVHVPPCRHTDHPSSFNNQSLVQRIDFKFARASSPRIGRLTIVAHHLAVDVDEHVSAYSAPGHSAPSPR